MLRLYLPTLSASSGNSLRLEAAWPGPSIFTGFRSQNIPRVLKEYMYAIFGNFVENPLVNVKYSLN